MFVAPKIKENLSAGKPLFYGKGRDGRHIMEVQLLHQVRAMFFRCPDTYAQEIGNLFVLIALGDQLQNSSFA